MRKLRRCRRGFPVRELSEALRLSQQALVNLERRTQGGWDTKLSLNLDRLVLVEENLIETLKGMEDE